MAEWSACWLVRISSGRLVGSNPDHDLDEMVISCATGIQWPLNPVGAMQTIIR